MKIRFRSRQLQRRYEQSAVAIAAYGPQVARKFIERIDIIQHVTDFETLKNLPGLYVHMLRGDREGQWSVKLTGYMRLILTLEGDHQDIVCIEEVSKHYDE